MKLFKQLTAIVIGIALWPIVIIGALLLAQGWTLALLTLCVLLVWGFKEFYYSLRKRKHTSPYRL